MDKKYEEIREAYENAEPKWWFTNEAAEAFDWCFNKVGELLKKYEGRRFPVLGKVGPSSVPWDWVMKHANSAKDQHAGQDVAKLASRGGMSVVELYYAMRDEKFPHHTESGEWPKIERKALEWIDTEPWKEETEMSRAKLLAQLIIDENKRLKAENASLRKLLWQKHGHGAALLYGEDGQMQCSRCLIDYMHDSVIEIGNRMDHAAKLLSESSEEG